MCESSSVVLSLNQQEQATVCAGKEIIQNIFTLIFAAAEFLQKMCLFKCFCQNKKTFIK